MAQTLVRVFYDDNEIKGWVIPDDDAELDLHHRSLISTPHTHIDLTEEEFYLHRYNGVGGVDKYKLHAFVKAKP